MKHNIKKVVSLFLCAAIIGVVTSTVDAKTVEPIQLGDDIYASISNNTLSISGEGNQALIQ